MPSSAIATDFIADTVTENSPCYEAIPPDRWVDEFGDYLYGYAFSRLHDRSAAEDAVQETFLAALQGLDRYQGKVEMKYWLRGILRNKTVDFIRRRVREFPSETLEQYDEAPSPIRRWFGIPTWRVDSWQFDPAEVLEDKDFWGVFEQCVAELGSPLREVFTLKEIENLSTEQICAEFNITPNNLWVMVHRARKRLKSALNQHWQA
jgi:RNA polymerase sigma-70 factor (ECF subfamily)